MKINAWIRCKPSTVCNVSIPPPPAPWNNRCSRLLHWEQKLFAVLVIMKSFQKEVLHPPRTPILKSNLRPSLANEESATDQQFESFADLWEHLPGAGCQVNITIMTKYCSVLHCLIRVLLVKKMLAKNADFSVQIKTAETNSSVYYLFPSVKPVSKHQGLLLCCLLSLWPKWNNIYLTLNE